MTKQDERLEKALRLVAEVGASFLGPFVASVSPETDVEDTIYVTLTQALSELGVNTAGIETESENIEIRVE